MLTTLLAALLAAPAPSGWYGPTTIVLPVQTEGNPYDPEQNDIQVRFRGPSGTVETRLAYFDGRQWKATLVAKTRGTYTPEILRNGRTVGNPRIRVSLTNPLPNGFVRKRGHWGFQYDDGQLYWPIGFNLGWQNGDLPDLTETLSEMGRSGLNWARIWACHWDNKNPWWKEGEKLPEGVFRPEVLDRWESLVNAAERAGVRFQFVLFHHGPWSTTVNPNWNENPLNARNGGHLAKPEEFFTNPRAKKLARAWLRYVVARYGHSPSVMAWELFNEVEWVDAVRNGQQAAVGAWHDEMARYLKALDKTGRLVTSSSKMDLPIYREMDFHQPHGYPMSVSALVLGVTSPDARPLFFGEVGLSGAEERPAADQAMSIKDGLWSGLFARHAGAGQYWYWDRVIKDRLYPVYTRSLRVFNDSRILSERNLTQVKPDVQAGSGSDLNFAPGGGWEPNTRFDFRLPEDTVSALSGFSAYFQGKGHGPTMRPKPVVFRFRAERPGTFEVFFTAVSEGGANFSIDVNGRRADQRSWPAGAKVGANELLRASFPAGDVAVTLDNDGTDWVQIGRVRVTGIGANAFGIGIGNRSMALVRLQAPNGADKAQSVRLGNLGLADGMATLRLYDLNSDRVVESRAEVRGGRLSAPIAFPGADIVAYLRAER